MATEFYKSIPESVKGKLDEYRVKYTHMPNLASVERLTFSAYNTPEGHIFWSQHEMLNTFPIWSDELNRFIDPPQVNTITVNADEYQAMREVMVSYLKDLYPKPFLHDSILAAAKRMGIDINEITN
jgi:hypothetical protein